jgi:hypothetical protein
MPLLDVVNGLQETKIKTCLFYGRFLFPCLRILINVFLCFIKMNTKKTIVHLQCHAANLQENAKKPIN